jgi:hypothetical protein
MKTEFIKKGEVIFKVGEEDYGNPTEAQEARLEELAKTETIKSIELTFIENASFDQVSDLFLHQEDGVVISQKVYLND